MFTYEEATEFVVSNLRRAADAQDAGRLGEIEAGFDELAPSLGRLECLEDFGAALVGETMACSDWVPCERMDSPDEQTVEPSGE